MENQQLRGSANQVAAANDVRAKFLGRLAAVPPEALVSRGDDLAPAMAATKAAVAGHKRLQNADFWLDRKNHSAESMIREIDNSVRIDDEDYPHDLAYLSKLVGNAAYRAVPPAPAPAPPATPAPAPKSPTGVDSSPVGDKIPGVGSRSAAPEPGEKKMDAQQPSPHAAVHDAVRDAHPDGRYPVYDLPDGSVAVGGIGTADRVWDGIKNLGYVPAGEMREKVGMHYPQIFKPKTAADVGAAATAAATTPHYFVEGDTFAHRAELSALGAQYHPELKKWSVTDAMKGRLPGRLKGTNTRAPGGFKGVPHNPKPGDRKRQYDDQDSQTDYGRSGGGRDSSYRSDRQRGQDGSL